MSVTFFHTLLLISLYCFICYLNKLYPVYFVYNLLSPPDASSSSPSPTNPSACSPIFDTLLYSFVLFSIIPSFKLKIKNSQSRAGTWLKG